MPLNGLPSIFSKKHFHLFCLTVLSVIIYSFAFPSPIFANYYKVVSDNGKCYIRQYNDSGNQVGQVEMDGAFCSGASSCSSVAKEPDCENTQAYVPGSGQASDCHEGGKIRARYLYNNGTNNPPTHLWLGASGCGANRTWSVQGPGRGLHLNIEYWDGDSFTSIRPGSSFPNRQSQEYYKIKNGEQEVTMDLRYLSGDMADYTKPKAFVIYPNCAGAEDSIDAGCFRMSNLPSEIFDPYKPSCSVTSTKSGNDYRVDISATDQGSGIIRMGLSYTPVNSSGTPTGGEIIQVNNDFMLPSGRTSVNQSFTIPGSSIAAGQRYVVKAKVWDVRGSNNYSNGNDYSANYAECTTPLQCIMPLEQVSFNMSCTPGVDPATGLQMSDSIVQALNLNSAGYCQIDYVNITEVGTTSPDAGTFNYPNYWNKSVTGYSSTPIPSNFRKRDTNALLIMGASKRYWISYYDQQSGQLTAGRSFVTPAACRPPSRAPSITYTPECKIDPGNINDPANPKRELRWTAISSAYRGDGFSGYEMEVWRNNTSIPQNRVYSASTDVNTTLAALGAWYVDELQPGNTYYYRVRGKSLGGPGPWSAFSSRLLIKKPSSPTNFIRSGYSSGMGASGTPYLDLDWGYSDNTAPVAASQGWRLEKLNAPGTITTLLAGSQTSYRQNLTLAQCNNTSHYYRLSGQNTCGQGPYAYGTFVCPANRAPTCNAIQYSTNNGATWNNYPTGSTGLTRDPSTGIILRRYCTDPEGNSIRYDWSTSAGCGTFNPASQTLASPSVNGSVTAFTFSANYNTSCNLTSTVRDTLGNVGPSATVVAKTYPLPSTGTHSMVLGTRSISRSNTSDAYTVIGSSTQDLATITYRIVGYNNATAQGSTTNRPGTARINTTATSLGNGKLNVCNPSYGTCTFVASGNQTVSNITSSTSFLEINVRLNPNYQPNIREVMVNPSTTNQIYSVRVDFSATTANGGTITASATGSPRINNAAPTCTSVVFGPTPGSPYRTGNITLAVTGRDDWGLGGLNISYVRTNGGSTTSVVNNPAQFTARTGTASFNINTANMVSGYYRFNISMTDRDGSSVSCYSSGNVTGDVPPSGSNQSPIVLVDKTAPVCGTGGTTVAPNAAGTLLGFTTAGAETSVNGSYSGLNRVQILVKRPTDANFQATPVLTYNLTTNPRPQTYTHTFSNASATTSYNISGLPSGVYTFRAVWTDQAGNVSATTTSPATPCDVTYEKRSRISGKVNLFTGVDGDLKRDYAVEASGAQFSVGTRATVSTPVTNAAWQNGGGSACQASYPGTAGSSTCAAYFVSGVEYATSAPPVVELSFPALASASGLGKYRCAMTVYNTTTSPWTVKRTIPNTNAAGSGATCSGTTCVCRFALATSDMSVNSAAAYSPTSIWPTHVEFDVSYNSDQVYGRVENEAGNVVPNGTYSVRVNQGSWTSAAAPVTGGGYSSPVPSPDNPSGYGRTNLATNVTLVNPDPTRLCIWASRNNFANPGANSQRTGASTAFAGANVRTVAQQLALPGFTVGASSQCTTQGFALNSGPESPKLQNQVNFLVLPKVQLTGRIYFLKSDNLCGNPASWTDSDNWATDAPLNVDLSFSTLNPTAVGPLDEFYNPANPSSLTGAATYTTGDTYTVYANSLPGSQWSNWQIQAEIDAGARYVSCGSGVIDVDTAIPNYPNGAGASVINAPIAVFMTEGNDWWQTYNGGVQALTAIQDRIPVATANREDTCSHDIHTIVGRATCAMYNSGPPLLRNPFRGYATGALVTTRGELLETAGRTNLNWTINDSVAWGDPDMKAPRLPFATTEGSNVTAIDNVKDNGDTEGWITDPGNLNAIGSGGNGKIYFSGDRTISSNLVFGNNNYLVIDGDLTINGNLLPTGAGSDMRQSVFIIASGDVTIAGNVSELNAYIYTPGTITVLSGAAGPDDASELQLKIYGGLYAGTRVDFRRDIANTDANWGYPSTQIMYNPALVVSSRNSGFPSQLKETNVYWTQQ